MKKIVVLTGAGISAESGISTFRDADGLWENHRIEDVASPEGWRRNRELVLNFYNLRRRQLFDVIPNAAHIALKKLENAYNMVIVTQNVDDLHERAGSTQVIHLHGELRKVRSTNNHNLIYDWDKDVNIGDKAADGAQLRPHIVWFGEAVPKIEDAANEISDADIVLVIGSSMQVYPAAGLVHYARRDADIYYIDPNPSINFELKQRKNLQIIADKAATAVPILVEKLLKA